MNKESGDGENVKEQPPKIGKTSGEINKLKCIDHNNDIMGHITKNREISWSEESQECAIYSM